MSTAGDDAIVPGLGLNMDKRIFPIHGGRRAHLLCIRILYGGVDSSYYSMPSERNSYLWAERTPYDFTFDIKAIRPFSALPTQQRALPREIRVNLGG